MVKSIEVLTIGDEILSGQIIDTNKAWLSEQCWQNGFAVAWHTGVRDDEHDIRDAILRAQSRADAVLVTGGLGPTADDFTIEIAARAFGVECAFDDATIKHLEQLYAKRGRTLSENNRKQALIPVGGRVLFNRIGTAPGVFYEFSKVPFYFMPGVPLEMKNIFQDHVLMDLLARRKEPVFYAFRQLKTFGCPESELDQKLKDLYHDRLNIGSVRIGFRVSFPDIFVKLSAWEKSQAAADQVMNDTLRQVYERIGKYVFTNDDRNLETVFLEKLRSAKMTFAVAESCTGGLVASRLTSVSGSSDVFMGGVVSYANAVKQSLLGVDSEVLKHEGAVSEACALAMLQGIAKTTQATCCAAVTGIAGPAGGSEDKPVGTVFVATRVNGLDEVEQLYFPFPRSLFQSLVASVVLQRILQRANLWPGTGINGA